MMNENDMIHETNQSVRNEEKTNNLGEKMETITCDTAGDLLPLYVDEVLSPASAALVEAHLAGCESCTEKVNSLKKETTVKDYSGAKPMKKFKNRFRMHKIITGVLVGVCVMVLVGLFLRLYHYDYSYDQLKNDIEVVSDSDGHVHIVYNGDKLLFSHYRYKLTGIKDGKAQYTILFYESVGAYDLYWYYFQSPPLMTKPEHESGKPFELVHICPNDKEQAYFCDKCQYTEDSPYIENFSMYQNGITSYMGLFNDRMEGDGIDIIYNYDKPNPYTEEEWDTLPSVNPDSDPYYPYETMEVEINAAVYCNFDSASLHRYRTYTVWER